MSQRPSLDDYVDVAERIQDFKDAHPDGSLQTIGWEIVLVEGYDVKAKATVKTTFIVYRAQASRTADDLKPGHGIAWEPFPGRTPYTKDSELMNAETAAWGRAICALGLVANRSLASRQEVRNRRADQEAEGQPEPAISKEGAASESHPFIDKDVFTQLRETFIASGHTDEQLCWFLLSIGVQTLPENPSKQDIGAAMKSLTLEQAFRLEALLKGEDDSVPGNEEAA